MGRLSDLAILAAVMHLLVGVSWADRVYVLEDYPAYQQVYWPESGNSYRLDGSLTVEDSAADDGILTEEEIISWEWVATTNDPDVLLQSSGGSLPNELGGGSTLASGLLVRDGGIYLPVDQTARFELMSLTRPGLGQSSFELIWSTSPSSEDNAIYTTRYSHYGIYQGDIGFVAWSTVLDTVESDVSPLLIARAIPEPGAVALAWLSLLGSTYMQRRMAGVGVVRRSHPST